MANGNITRVSHTRFLRNLAVKGGASIAINDIVLYDTTNNRPGELIDTTVAGVTTFEGATYHLAFSGGPRLLAAGTYVVTVNEPIFAAFPADATMPLLMHADRFQAGTAHQGSIHVRHSHQLGDIIRLDGTTIQNARFIRQRGIGQFRQIGANNGMNFLSLRTGRRSSRANGPDGLIRHHQLAKVIRSESF